MVILYVVHLRNRYVFGRNKILYMYRKMRVYIVCCRMQIMLCMNAWGVYIILFVLENALLFV